METTAATIRVRIEGEVQAGVHQPGDRLPPVRTLATELGVSPNTVASAYKQLRERGVVIGRGRQGTVVAPVSRPILSQITSVPAGVVDALRGSPDERLLPDLESAFIAATSGAHVAYGDPLLDEGFALAARSIFEADGIDANNLVTTSGAMDAIEKMLVANDLRPGDRVGVEDPGHVPVHQLVRSAGLEVVPLAIDEQGIRPDALRGALSSTLAALIITPRAQNPTGASFTKERAAQLSEILSGHADLFLIQDDHAGAISGVAWHGLTPPGTRHTIIRSLGKSLGPDLRISVAVGDPVTIERVGVAISNGPGWVSHLLQRAAGYLLTSKDTTKLVERAGASYAKRREQLIAALAQHDIASSGKSGINVWIPTVDEQATVEFARAAGYAIRAGDMYRVESGPAVRVTVSNLDHSQIEELATVLAAGLATRPHSSAM